MKTKDGETKVSRKGIAKTFAKYYGELCASVAPKHDDTRQSEEQQETSDTVGEEERNEKPIQSNTSDMRASDHSRNECSSNMEEVDHILNVTTIEIQIAIDKLHRPSTATQFGKHAKPSFLRMGHMNRHKQLRADACLTSCDCTSAMPRDLRLNDEYDVGRCLAGSYHNHRPH